jgi:hypothetical protein
MEQGESAVLASMADGKCPYLAGRPPHGTYKLWPSSINVCYGRPQGGKTYGQVSKETQERYCFAGEGTFCRCADYERALSASVAPPQFGRALTSEDPANKEGDMRRVRKRRRKKRHSHSQLGPVMRSVVFVVVLLATIATVAVVMMK